MALKKVLIITYYWPPAGGPGVQRVLKFAKYLPAFGWQPLVLTVQKGEYPARDETLAREIPTECQVFRSPSLEPNTIYKKFTGLPADQNIPVAVLAERQGNWKKRLAHAIRLNLFIPDAKIGWIPFGIKHGKRIISELKPDIIFSSSPPPTVHLIARRLARYSGLPWIADFRDPWTDIHYYENHDRLAIAKRLDHALESKVLRDADLISCISHLDIELDFAPRIQGKQFVNIANGYDEEDFQELDPDLQKTNRFVLMHLGGVGPERNPQNLFRAVHTLHNESLINPQNFELVFIGNVENSVLASIRETGIEPYFHRVDYLPHHEALARTRQATVMLLLVTQSDKNLRILPGKTFEYMRTGKPILALGPKGGEVDRILTGSKTGTMLSYTDLQQVTSTLQRYFTEWQKNGKVARPPVIRIQDYSRRALTQKLATVMESLT